MRATSLPRARRAMELRIGWRGGGSVDLVKLVVDGAFRRPRDVLVESGRERLVISLEVDEAARHELELLVAFVGEARDDLSLEVKLDGRPVGLTARCEHASQRWEVRWSWP
jgi:hypothetical protein